MQKVKWKYVPENGFSKKWNWIIYIVSGPFSSIFVKIGAREHILITHFVKHTLENFNLGFCDPYSNFLTQIIIFYKKWVQESFSCIDLTRTLGKTQKTIWLYVFYPSFNDYWKKWVFLLILHKKLEALIQSLWAAVEWAILGI